LLNLAGEFRGELLEGFASSDHRDFEAWLLTLHDGDPGISGRLKEVTSALLPNTNLPSFARRDND
jgi:hypothetical protein